MKIFIIGLFAVDRLLKLHFASSGAYILNTGIAFGVISAKPEFVIVSHFLLTSLLIYYLYKTRLDNSAINSIFLIISGSISNLIDRFMYNGVVDYISLWIFPKFNLADIMVVLGVLLLIFLELNEYYKNVQSRRNRRG